jgi:hypothetical protein
MDDILKEAQEAFAECEAAERANREAARDDIRFARLGEQWDEGLRAKRAREGRPCLTINKLPPFIRQVVNDARQNMPSIKVMPQDSVADPATAAVLSGLIRNIEASSDADVAYDTALECAATSGVGYFRLNLAYAHDDNWDQDIVFQRVANPFSIYGDPTSEAADSSDWNLAFVTETMPRAAFQRRFKGAAETDWSAQDFAPGWAEGDQVRVAEYWKRREVRRKIALLTDGRVMDLKAYEADASLRARGIMPHGRPREVLSYAVEQHILSGVEALEKTDWAGKFIPIVPVYGEEVNLDGRRHFRSLIRDAKDAQVMYNAWRTASTELVALAPKTPFIGPAGAFASDAGKWATANSTSHAYIEYDGPVPPQRQAFSGPPAGALQEALNANDDIKAIIGLYDASLGARSNETSGRAILARQREGDVSTFHFVDNLSRAIRHAGRILIDLIPKVYGEDRMVRILGEDRTAQTVKLGAPEAARASQGPGLERIHALGVGKYDLTVSAGPSFTTRREEAANQMIELMRANPAVAPIIGDLLARNLDWPGADEIARRLQVMLPPQLKGGDPQAQAQIAQMKQQTEAMKAQGLQMIAALKAELAATQGRLQAMGADKGLDARKLEIEAFKAQTDRMEAEARAGARMVEAV